MIEFGKKGGGVLEVKTMYPKGDLIDALSADLTAIGFKVSKKDVEDNYELIKSLFDRYIDRHVRPPATSKCYIPPH